VYDALGRQVEKLASEELYAGVYKYKWNAENFSSGIYFYRLVTGKYSAVKKMVLIK
jgi:hypothetical protein